MHASFDGGPPIPVVDCTYRGAPVEYVRSDGAMMPNPKWSATDEHGHEHRWALTDRESASQPEALPTLVRSLEHIDCDGTCGNWDCDGYEIHVWHCAVCGDTVEPGYVPDYLARTSGIPIVTGSPSLTIVVDQWGNSIEWGQTFNVVVSGEQGDGRVRMTGRAWPASVDHDMNGTEVTFEVALDQ